MAPVHSIYGLRLGHSDTTEEMQQSIARFQRQQDLAYHERQQALAGIEMQKAAAAAAVAEGNAAAARLHNVANSLLNLPYELKAHIISRVSVSNQSRNGHG